MKNLVFFDTEFMDTGTRIIPISIGAVKDDGSELYVEFPDIDWSEANEFVLETVKPFLLGEEATASIPDIRKKLIDFAGEAPVFWAYYGAYDWVMLAQTFGTMMELPEGWPKFARDIKQLMDFFSLEKSDVPAKPDNAHFALADAKWNKQVYDYIVQDIDKRLITV
jgi:hypothetical protein